MLGVTNNYRITIFIFGVILYLFCYIEIRKCFVTSRLLTENATIPFI